MELDQALSKLEDFSDVVVRKSRPIIPVLGRFLLVSTFFEDSYRMLTNPKIHLEHFTDVWHMWNWLAIICYIYCASMQLVMPAFILIRKRVAFACISLAVVSIFQCITYEIYESFTLLLRWIAVVGGLLILAAEILTETKPQSGASLPHLHEEIETKSIVILVGRIYLIAMMISFLHVDDLSFWRVIQLSISILLSVAVVCGYRMRLAALVLAIWMLFFNIYRNGWWNAKKHSYDYMKFDFFQTLSAIGGLLLLIHMGPGEIRMDKYKKQW